MHFGPDSYVFQSEGLAYPVARSRVARAPLGALQDVASDPFVDLGVGFAVAEADLHFVRKGKKRDERYWGTFLIAAFATEIVLKALKK